ncbi:hypothetical protein LY76DRAFT_415721 [Colletotrichum caudatum]|nr:hypothetical protein LY76DRAFT_415721 [Colletotrichum caudatum]
MRKRQSNRQPHRAVAAGFRGGAAIHDGSAGAALALLSTTWAGMKNEAKLEHHFAFKGGQ